MYNLYKCFVLYWISLQMLPATYEMAFAGNRDELTKKLAVSHGLLVELLDKQIISHQHCQAIEVLQYS